MSNPKFTEQQSDIISCNDSTIIVEARAGTGKTFVCEHYARSHPTKSFLYAVFNRSSAQEANRRMPANVYNTTMHGHAFSVTGRRLSQKLSPNYRLKQLVEEFRLGRRYQLAYKAKEGFQAFLASNKTMEQFAEWYESTKQPGLDIIQQMWERACDPSDPFPATHDVYLKLYQLSKPKLDFDCIMIDEAQDWNPVMLDILLNQDHAQRILVGDPFQQLYAFRGAVDAMSMVEGTRKYLTQSWRFHQGIANIANRILAVRDPGLLPIEGMKAEENPQTDQWCVLARTNGGLMGRLIKEVDQNPNIPLYFIGGRDGYKFDPILDAYHLWKNDIWSIKDQFIKNQFPTWRDLRVYIEETTQKRPNGSELRLDPEMYQLYNLVETYRDKIPVLVDRVRQNVTENRGEAELVLGTGHKAKGWEFPKVELLDDFYDYREYKQDRSYMADMPNRIAQLDNEVNLLYVAATRAEQVFKSGSAQLPAVSIENAIPTDKDHNGQSGTLNQAQESAF